MADLLIELDGAHFKRQYLLYIVEINHQNERFFYIGQTGDRKYTTARPAFRRLAGHFDDSGTSTQNQVYRYIGQTILKLKFGSDCAFSQNEKLAMENYLVNSKIKMHIYILEPFLASETHEKHLEKLNKVEEFEAYIVESFEKNGRNILNKKRSPKRTPNPYPQKFAQIAHDFKLN